jgi:type II secretory pathway predicted ATPase ExeA
VGATPTIWLGEPLREAVEAVETAVRGDGGLIVVTGDVGVGKTTLARALIERLGDSASVASLLYPHVRATELRAVLRDAWVPGAEVETRETFLHAIDMALDAADAGKQSLLLLVDEAQGLTPEALEEIAALLQHAAARPQLSVLLVGQDELASVLAASPLHGRTRLLQRIRTLQEREIQEYVTARRGVSLSLGESREIARATRGVPRLIERLCDNREAARLAAAATTPADTHDDDATGDDRSQPSQTWRRARWVVPAGVGLALAALAAWWVTGVGEREASAPAQVSAPAPAPDSQPGAGGAQSATPEIPPGAVGAVAGPGVTEASPMTGSSTSSASPTPTAPATAVPEPRATTAPRPETPPSTPPAPPQTEKAQAPTAPRADTPVSTPPATPRTEKAQAPTTPGAETTPRAATPPARATTQPRATSPAVDTPRVGTVPDVKRSEPVRPRPAPEARTETAPRTATPPAVVPPPTPRAESQRARPAPEPRRDDAAGRDRGGDDDPGAVIDWLLRERRP